MPLPRIGLQLASCLYPRSFADYPAWYVEIAPARVR
jgi:hypothetical protein